jgi:TRAP-type uncharacterized transport system fused permease subunit
VFGELTPPTSITAAITSKIAEASFYTTLWRSVQICMSLFTLMAGVFVHPELVQEPGWNQMGAAYLILVATLGLTFSLQATYSDNNVVDRAFRVLLAGLALYIVFSFNDFVSDIVSAVILGAIAYWIVYRRKHVEAAAPPAETTTAMAAE